MLKYEFDEVPKKDENPDASTIELTQRIVRQCCPMGKFHCEIAEKRIKGDCRWCTGQGCDIVDGNLEEHRAPKANMTGWKTGFGKRGVVEVVDYGPVLDDPSFDIREVVHIPKMDVDSDLN